MTTHLQQLAAAQKDQEHALLNREIAEALLKDAKRLEEQADKTIRALSAEYGSVTVSALLAEQKGAEKPVMDRTIVVGVLDTPKINALDVLNHPQWVGQRENFYTDFGRNQGGRGHEIP